MTAIPNKYAFKEFWKLYPKGYRNGRHGCIQGGMDNAESAWAKLRPDQRERAMKAVVLIQKDAFVPHAGKWLRQNYYDPLLENEQSKRKKSVYHSTDKQSKGYEPWIMEQSRASLETFLKQMPQMEWLVKKLRPELGF